MSIYHFHMSNLKRNGKSHPLKTLAYNTGREITNPATGEVYRYNRKERVVWSKLYTPAGEEHAFRDAESLFNALSLVDTTENANVCKKITLGLPREFDRDTAITALQQFIEQNVTNLGYACSVAIHTDTQNGNPHAHLLITGRKIKDGKFKPKWKTRRVLDEDGNPIPAIDKKTGEQKRDNKGALVWKREKYQVNELDEKETLLSMRANWAQCLNQFLSEKDQVDHRSFKDRGIEREPTVHVGVAQSAMKQKGARLDYDKQQLNEIIQEKNQAIDDLEKTLETHSALNQENLNLLEIYNRQQQEIRAEEQRKECLRQDCRELEDETQRLIEQHDHIRGRFSRFGDPRTAEMRLAREIELLERQVRDRAQEYREEREWSERRMRMAGDARDAVARRVEDLKRAIERVKQQIAYAIDRLTNRPQEREKPIGKQPQRRSRGYER